MYVHFYFGNILLNCPSVAVPLYLSVSDPFPKSLTSYNTSVLANLTGFTKRLSDGFNLYFLNEEEGYLFYLVFFSEEKHLLYLKSSLF